MSSSFPFSNVRLPFDYAKGCVLIISYAQHDKLEANSRLCVRLTDRSKNNQKKKERPWNRTG